MIDYHERHIKIDYRDLLKRYIQHVYMCVGVTFIKNIEDWEDDGPKFTEEEVKELQQLDEESTAK